MRLQLILLLLGSCRALQPGPDANGDGVVDENEAFAMQQLSDMLADAAALLSNGSARSKESAAEGIARMALMTTISQPFHPVTFRNAAVKAGIVELLVGLLAAPTPGGAPAATPAAQAHALAALEAIATDDPSTDLDNDHARYVCSAGAVKPVVRLLSSRDPHIQVQAAACAAILAECVPCQTALSGAKAEEPLVQLATFGSDVAKLHAIAALELIALNNPTAQARIAAAGGLQLLHGIESFGFSAIRGVAGSLASGLEQEPGTTRVSVDVKSHARMAHETRLKHSKIWERAVGQPRAYSKMGQGEGGGEGDARSECVKWAAEGECEQNPGYMLEHCPQSCAGMP